ncbi:hypothetical protein FD755_014040 [Muntiacus reevesi]|uniref:PPIase cyclophilin-type domain-containing protein n=1 Tax=Muntiacus reevesi TaxID=9886 RepID=A0A5N3XJ62_MUNRE|nr:hypothetical protein FD755_014040 [Muntiacus reevesi]
MVNPIVFFDIAVNSEPLDHVSFKLFANKVPKSRSNYGEKLEDEYFILKHTGPGILSMADAGPNTNSSQFLICSAKIEWLDGKHAVFGKSRNGKTVKKITIADCGQI